MAQAQRKELNVSRQNRPRPQRVMPVGADGTVYTSDPRYSRGPQRAEKVGPASPKRLYRDTSREQREDVVDAEVVDEQPAPEQEQTPEGETWAQERERLRDSSRSFFGGIGERVRAHRQRREADQDRIASDDEGLDEREQLLKLRSQIREAGEQYMTSLRESNILVPGFEQEVGLGQKSEKKLDAMHQVYVQMMMQGCLRPLSRGVNPTSVIQTMGTMAALTALSPDFRNQVGQFAKPVRDQIQQKIDGRVRSVGASAQEAADRSNELLDARVDEFKKKLAKNPELAEDEGFMARHDKAVRRQQDKRSQREDHLSKKWRKRLEKIEHRDRGSRMPYTEESAAMTEIGLMENAFWKMRDPSTDTGEIHDSYRAMRKRLHEQMADDGLDMDQVRQYEKMIIGQRMEHEPELRLMFNGLAQGRFHKAPPHEEKLAGTDKVRSVWRGEFVDVDGASLNGGMFTLRRPMNAQEHQVQLSKAMSVSIEDARNKGSEAFAGHMFGYLVGFAARGQGVDPATVPEAVRRPVEQCETMLASMEIDGLSPEEQRTVYSNAFADTMSEMVTKHPEFDHDLRLAIGEDYMAQLKEATSDPGAFLHEQWTKPRPFRAGPTASDRTQQEQWGADGPSGGQEDYQPA